MPKHYKSHGKLLLTGEYVVLDGAKALALPTVYSQTLIVTEDNSNIIGWKSYDETNTVWFCGEFKFEKATFKIASASDKSVAERLVQIFEAIQDLNPDIFQNTKGLQFITSQDFNRQWGLGTSSTLINNLANWSNIDAYKLLQNTFGGSGYDIACAKHQSPLIYQMKKGSVKVETVDFNPKYRDQLYFVYLNQKKNSRDGIAYYKSQPLDLNKIIEVSNITEALLTSSSFSDFQKLLKIHEDLISNLTKQPKIALQFPDFKGALKSLGAWGGDFILACSKENPTSYFKEKGFKTVIPYKKMVI